MHTTRQRALAAAQCLAASLLTGLIASAILALAVRAMV